MKPRLGLPTSSLAKRDFNVAAAPYPTGLNLLTTMNSLSRTHRGIKGTIGATAKFTGFELEPVVQAIYKERPFVV
ncbi:MAG: hypothetical protein GX443_13395 [Deltaproteobacteria bacterium]|nr:hypothetical protein [Deltaproteobacteria bacterium]